MSGTSSDREEFLFRRGGIAYFYLLLYPLDRTKGVILNAVIVLTVWRLEVGGSAAVGDTVYSKYYDYRLFLQRPSRFYPNQRIRIFS